MFSHAIGRTFRRSYRHHHPRDHRRDRGDYFSRLRARLGRRHPVAIWRAAAQALRLRLRRPARPLLRQSLQIRRRLRHGGGACRQGIAVRPVRNAASHRRGGRHRRSDRHLAARPPARRTGRRPGRADAVGRLPALLRAHVHEPEGCALRRRHDAAAARSGARVRRISQAQPTHDAVDRHRHWRCVRFACSRRACRAGGDRRLHADLRCARSKRRLAASRASGRSFRAMHAAGAR